MPSGANGSWNANGRMGGVVRGMAGSSGLLETLYSCQQHHALCCRYDILVIVARYPRPVCASGYA